MTDPDSLRTALCFGEPKNAVESVRVRLRKAIRSTGVQNLAKLRGVSTDDMVEDLTTAAFMRAKRYGCGRRRDDPIRYFPSWLATRNRSPPYGGIVRNHTMRLIGTGPGFMIKRKCGVGEHERRTGGLPEARPYRPGSGTGRPRRV